MADRAYFLDCELTDKKDGEIIEAAWLRVRAVDDLGGTSDLLERALHIDAHFASRFKPTKTISFGAMAVHHILPHWLERCPPASDFKLPDDCGYLIGHSIDFDWQACGAPANVKRIDTHAIAQWVWPEATGYSLVALIYMTLGATETTRELARNAHGAAADVDLCRLLLLRILEARPEITTWAQLWEFSEECRIPRTCPMKRNEGVLLEDLDPGFVQWCLDQHWLDPYFRKGLLRVVENWNANSGYGDPDEFFDADDEDDIEGEVQRAFDDQTNGGASMQTAVVAPLAAESAASAAPTDDDDWPF